MGMRHRDSLCTAAPSGEPSRTISVPPVAFPQPVAEVTNSLTRDESVELILRAAIALAEGRAPAPAEARFLGTALLAWLDGAELEQALGVRPPRGSKRRPEAIVAQREVDRRVLSFAARVGTDREASALLRGERVCPDELQPELAELRSRGAPSSPAGISRARRRVSHHRG